MKYYLTDHFCHKQFVNVIVRKQQSFEFYVVFTSGTFLKFYL